MFRSDNNLSSVYFSLHSCSKHLHELSKKFDLQRASVLGFFKHCKKLNIVYVPQNSLLCAERCAHQQ